MSLALSSVALLLAGQVSQIRLTIGDQTTYSFNATQCGSTVSAAFQTTLGAATVCGPLQLFVTDATSCPNEPASGDYALTEVPQSTLLINRNQSDSRTIEIAKLPFFVKNTADGGTQCGAPGIDVTHLFCAAVQVGSSFGFDPCANKSTVKAATPVTIRYDTKAPGAPTIDSAEGLDGSASVTVSADSDTSQVRVEFRAPGGDWQAGATTVGSSRALVVSGLANGTAYEFRAIAIDDAGNESAPSEVVTATPKLSCGFWCACVDSGCPPQGCTAASAAPFLLGALALVMLRRRIRR